MLWFYLLLYSTDTFTKPLNLSLNVGNWHHFFMLGTYLWTTVHIFSQKKKISFKSNWNNNQILFSISEVLPFWLTTRSAMMGRILSRTTWWNSATSWGCWDIPSRTDMVVVTKSEGEIDPEKNRQNSKRHLQLQNTLSEGKINPGKNTQTEFMKTITEYTVWRWCTSLYRHAQYTIHINVHDSQMK